MSDECAVFHFLTASGAGRRSQPDTFKGEAQMPDQRIGYVGVNTLDQNEQRHLEGEGEVLDRVFTDKTSDKDANRSQLVELTGFVCNGNTVVVHSMDRLVRNLEDLRAVVRILNSKGVRVELLK
jgi:DNA invertase Pin-like site-specific DNA recombinase